MAAEPYRFVRHGRSRATVAAVAFVWALCLALWITFDAAPWLIGLILLCTLPAVRDIWTGSAAGAELTADRLRWFSGRRSAEVPLAEIDHVRLVTRPDFSVRAAVVLGTGRKLRLPVEATPPHRAFAEALAAHGIRAERHHFTSL